MIVKSKFSSNTSFQTAPLEESTLFSEEGEISITDQISLKYIIISYLIAGIAFDCP